MRKHLFNNWSLSLTNSLSPVMCNSKIYSMVPWPHVFYIYVVIKNVVFIQSLSLEVWFPHVPSSLLDGQSVSVGSMFLSDHLFFFSKTYPEPLWQTLEIWPKQILPYTTLYCPPSPSPLPPSSLFIWLFFSSYSHHDNNKQIYRSHCCIWFQQKYLCYISRRDLTI